MTAQPTYFLSHGGGPWPWMPEAAPVYAALARSLAELPGQLPEPPQALLVVTAHWEAPSFTVGTAARPGMIYDYGGFPPHTYEVVYPAPGAPALGARVQALAAAAGIEVAADAQRGYDHGTFVPLAAMAPQAQVPVLQVSLKRGLDPAAHLAFGRALAPLRDEGVLILGSGLSYHNLRAFGPPGAAASAAFDGWLQQVLPAPGAPRNAALLDWAAAPAARQAHPREEHLLPLMVAVGAAEAEPGRCVYRERDFMGALTVSSFRFG